MKTYSQWKKELTSIILDDTIPQITRMKALEQIQSPEATWNACKDYYDQQQKDFWAIKDDLSWATESIISNSQRYVPTMKEEWRAKEIRKRFGLCEVKNA